jgi:hypothetical protein
MFMTRDFFTPRRRGLVASANALVRETAVWPLYSSGHEKEFLTIRSAAGNIWPPRLFSPRLHRLGADYVDRSDLLVALLIVRRTGDQTP